MKLNGKVDGLDILILVDSGSVGTFISDRLAQQLNYELHTSPTSQYLTANGTPMTCDKKIPNMQWSVQGHIFALKLEYCHCIAMI